MPYLPSRRAVENRTKQSQDVGGSSSHAKKPRARMVILRPPPPVPSDEEEEEELFWSFRILLPHSLLPRWSTSPWTPPACRAPTLGTSVPLPPSLTPTKRVTTVMTTRKRTTSSSCYYPFLLPFWCLAAKGGKVAILFPFSCSS
jgi:hypothetical protein